MQRAGQMVALLALLAMTGAVACGPSFAADKEVAQTTAQELMDRRFRPPSAVKVAVLPFYCGKGIERQTRAATSAIGLSLMRCGFEFAPQLKTRDSGGLAAVLCEAQKAVAVDGNIRPGAALKAEDAVRVGRVLGADWVIFGDILDMHSFTSHTVLAMVKKGTATIRLEIAEVASGELILDRQRQETVAAGPGLIGSRKATALERDAAQHCLQGLYADLCAALPAHRHDPEAHYQDGAVLSVQEAWDALLPEGTPVASYQPPTQVSASAAAMPVAAKEEEGDDATSGNDLVACVARGELGVEAYAAAAGIPGSLMAITTNKKGTSVGIDIAPGTVFITGTEPYGRVVARKVTAAKSAQGPRAPTDRIELEAHETKAFYLEAYALEMDGEFPPADTRLQMGRIDDAAGAVLAVASEKQLTHRVTQAALWVKAGGASIEAVAARLSLDPGEIASLQEIELQ